MRFRLLRRRLTISAPRMAVRSALPWPVRWLVAAVVLGFCAAVSLWAFELGKTIAGVDTGAKEELVRLRAEASRLREDNEQRLAVAQAAESLRAADRATVEGLMAQVRQLEADNRVLREDLGFFEKLIPAGKGDGPQIRGLQVERVGDGQVRWQLLVLQAQKNAPAFQGRVEWQWAGILDGKPWTQDVQGGQPLQFQHYRRLDGALPLPAKAVVKTLTVRIMDGSTVRATQMAELG